MMALDGSCVEDKDVPDRVVGHLKAAAIQMSARLVCRYIYIWLCARSTCKVHDAQSLPCHGLCLYR